MILADKIIRLRKKNGWSQEELAEKMNVFEYTDGIACPDTQTIPKLAEILGVSVEELLRSTYFG